MQKNDYEKIAAAIRFIRSRTQDQPGLDEIADYLNLSPFHFQRLFQRWAGISPKRFLQYLTSQHAKTLLKDARSTYETSLHIGLSGGGRLHDLFVTIYAVTPGEYRSGGVNLEIRWGTYLSPFGECLLATTSRGLCALYFVETAVVSTIDRLRSDWPHARLIQDMQTATATGEQVFALLDGSQHKPISLLLKGTNFQLQVWQALLKIPRGQLASYGQLARSIGNPRGSRAVGTAIGENPIAWLIPCHRVLRGDGTPGGYRWGEERKLAILGQELAQSERNTLPA